MTRGTSIVLPDTADADAEATGGAVSAGPTGAVSAVGLVAELASPSPPQLPTPKR